MVNQAILGGIRYDVVSQTQYYDNPNIYNPNRVCIMNPGDQYVLPVRTGQFNPNVPGFYPNTGSPFVPVAVPMTPEDEQFYSVGNMVNFENIDNIGELLAANAEIAEMERRFLTEPDNVFRPVIDENDDPLLIGLKQALGSKKIDLGAPYYKERMGDNYNNNNRLIKGGKTDITYKKTVEYCDCVDIEMVVTFRNKNDNVPNPMPSPITVVCTH